MATGNSNAAKTFYRVICDVKNQSLVHQLLLALVPQEIQQRVIDEFNAHMCEHNANCVG